MAYFNKVVTEVSHFAVDLAAALQNFFIGLRDSIQFVTAYSQLNNSTTARKAAGECFVLNGALFCGVITTYYIIGWIFRLLVSEANDVFWSTKWLIDLAFIVRLTGFLECIETSFSPYFNIFLLINKTMKGLVIN